MPYIANATDKSTIIICTESVKMKSQSKRKSQKTDIFLNNNRNLIVFLKNKTNASEQP